MTGIKLKKILNNKRGLGAPVGNLIILLAAVILSSTVVLFASNVTANQVQKESLYISEVTLNPSEATIVITNTGPTSIKINQIVIKGEKLDYTSDPASAKTDGIAKGTDATLTVAITEGLVTSNDIGRPITIVIYTTQATYFAETLVQATAGGSGSGSS
jgi:hypothetical protein